MKSKCRICFCGFVLIAAFFPLDRSCWGLDTAEVLERLHERYSKEDFEADFVQEAHLKAVDIIDTAEGHVLFKPPHMMRWHYVVPEEYFIIVDGKTVWMYKPLDKQVMTGDVQEYFGNSTRVDYFNNPKELSKEFVIELNPDGSGEAGHHVLRLLPKTELAELAALFLFVSTETFEITKAVTENPFGDRTTLRFSNYEYNRKLDPCLFKFDVPKGVEVIEFQ